MNRSFRVGFCVSGGGRLFRSATVHRDAVGIRPALAVLEGKAADELDAFCTSHGVPFTRVAQEDRRAFDTELAQRCVDADLDLLCLTFDKLIPARLVRHYRHRIINLHPALLPAFPGMHALKQAHDANARFVGATIHEVDEGMDTGAVVAQCVLGTRLGEVPASIGGRLYNLMQPMFLQVLAWYAERRVRHDPSGRVWIDGATYGELPISPALERAFPD